MCRWWGRWRQLHVLHDAGDERHAAVPRDDGADQHAAGIDGTSAIEGGAYVKTINIDEASGDLNRVAEAVRGPDATVLRELQGIIEEIEREVEEASATLGATRAYTLRRVILPMLAPAALTGFALAFARALGEYGSVIFIAGNMPMVSEITPLLIITKLEQYDYAGATAIAVVMLLAAFTMLLAINALQAWTRAKQGR